MPRPRKSKASFSTIGWLVLGTSLVIVSLFYLDAQDINLASSLKTTIIFEGSGVGGCFDSRGCTNQTLDQCAANNEDDYIFHWTQAQCPDNYKFASKQFVNLYDCYTESSFTDLKIECGRIIKQTIESSLVCPPDRIFTYIGPPTVTYSKPIKLFFTNTIGPDGCDVTCSAVASCVDPKAPPPPPYQAAERYYTPIDPPPVRPPPAGDDGSDGETPSPDPKPAPKIIDCRPATRIYGTTLKVSIGTKVNSGQAWINYINLQSRLAFKNDSCEDATARASSELKCNQAGCTKSGTATCKLTATSFTNSGGRRVPTVDDLWWNPDATIASGGTNQDVVNNGNGVLEFKHVNSGEARMTCDCSLSCVPSNQSGGGRTFFGIILNPLELLKNWLSRLSNPTNNPAPPPLTPPAVNIQPGLPPENVFACKPDSPLCIGLNKVLGS